MFVKSAFAQIEDGIKGLNRGIPTGIPKYDQYIFGTRKKTYYLYGANTGSGKTRFIRDKHMYVPFDHYLEINNHDKLDVHFIDFTLEVSPEDNIVNGLSRKIWLEEQVTIPTSKIFGWGSTPLTDTEKALLYKYKRYFELLESKCTTISGNLDASKLDKILIKHANKFGYFKTSNDTKVEISSIHDLMKQEEIVYENYPAYKALHVIVFIDTINATGLKNVIDDISRTCGLYRDMCKFTFIVAQQFNAENSSTDRSRFGVMTPLLRDFEDSKRTTKEADVVIGMYNPSEQQRTEFNGYDISIMKDKFRSLHLLKGRNGVVNKYIPLYFDGEHSRYEQLPSPELMDYDKYNL